MSRYSILFAVILMTVMLCGCAVDSANTSKQASEDAAANNELAANKDFINPTILTGNATESKHRIVYIWSHDCSNCRSQFRYLFRYYKAATEHKDVSFMFVEYEENQKTIDDEMVPALCGGSDFYQWYTLLFLSGIKSIDKAKELNAQHGGVYKGCPNQDFVKFSVKQYMAKIKQMMPAAETEKGHILIDGNTVVSKRGVETALAK